MDQDANFNDTKPERAMLRCHLEVLFQVKRAKTHPWVANQPNPEAVKAGHWASFSSRKGRESLSWKQVTLGIWKSFQDNSNKATYTYSELWIAIIESLMQESYWGVHSWAIEKEGPRNPIKTDKGRDGSQSHMWLAFYQFQSGSLAMDVQSPLW